MIGSGSESASCAKCADDWTMYAGMTSENVAERYGITRQQQDEMAARSHKRAGDARASGRFKDEIVPVKTVWKSKEVSTPPSDFSPVRGWTMSALWRLDSTISHEGYGCGCHACC